MCIIPAAYLSYSPSRLHFVMLILSQPKTNESFYIPVLFFLLCANSDNHFLLMFLYSLSSNFTSTHALAPMQA